MTNNFSEDNLSEENDILLTEEELRQLEEDLSHESYDFAVNTIKDRHRAIVLSAAARLDLILEKILKKLMEPPLRRGDNLFDVECPLSSFSAKISLAYRLGVIDNNFEHALQMVRKIRNKFAHLKGTLSLSISPYRDWVDELVRVVRRNGDSFDGIAEGLRESNYPSDLIDFATAVILLISKLSMVEAVTRKLEPFRKAEIVE